MSRVFNFSAGPAVLPESVLQEAAAEMLNYRGTGMSVMEMSHRSKAYQAIIDEVCIIKDEEALETSRALAAKEGILCGISSGTNVAAALRMAKLLGKGKRIVTVLPDTAERYFSTPLFDE